MACLVDGALAAVPPVRRGSLDLDRLLEFFLVDHEPATIDNLTG